MNIIELTVHELQEKIKSKEITITQIVEAYCERIKEKESKVDADFFELIDSMYKERVDD